MDELNEKENEKREMVHPDYQDEILEIIKNTSSPRQLRQKLEDFHAYDLLQVIEKLNDEDKRRVLASLATDQLAEVFEYVESDELSTYLKLMRMDRGVAALNQMEPDKVAAMVKSLDEEQQNLLFLQLAPSLAKAIHTIQSYDDEKIGSRMTTNYIRIPSGLSVKQAMGQVTSQARTNDNIDTIYIVNPDGTFHGAISIKDLIVARDGDDLEQHVSTSYPYLFADEDIDQVVDELRDYSEDSIPILNRDMMIEGVITAQDLLEVMDEEMGEDYAMFAGLREEEDLNEPLFQSLKKRLPWLLSLLGLSLIVSSVVSIFEVVVAALTIAMVFQSLILDMAGNVGTQSLAVTIRVLVDDELDTKDQIGFILKEARVGASNGLIIGFLSMLVLTFYIYAFKPYGLADAFSIALCVAASLLLAMTLSSVTGTAIPIVLKRRGVDPAVASGPLITTLNDLFGIIIYYGLCWIFLIQLLGL